MSFIVGIVGAFLLSLSTFCQSTAPLLYSYSLFLVVTYWLGLFILILYLIKLSFGKSIAKAIVERTKEETLKDVEDRLFKTKFKEFDKDNENRIKREDMSTVLKTLGIYVPDEEQAQLLETLDPTQTGFIQYQVFERWFKGMVKDDDNVQEDENDEDFKIFKR